MNLYEYFYIVEYKLWYHVKYVKINAKEKP